MTKIELFGALFSFAIFHWLYGYLFGQSNAMLGPVVFFGLSLLFTRIWT